MRVRRGHRPLLIVAPHGGRRQPERRPWTSGALRVNDLHTADFAWELAERLDADALVNDEIDRNDLDLNRLTQIRARAPWFLDSLGERLESMHGHQGAAVLFVHGWNVVNPTCDVGLGAALDRPVREPRAPETRPPLSIDDAFLAQRIGGLRQACSARGIATGLGWRYPASSATNLLQLFTRRYHDDPDARLRHLARLGLGINAVQLELGIPLRFPGVWRSRFIDACIEAFGSTPPGVAPGAGVDPTLVSPPATDGLPRRVAMQFHRPDGAIAGLVACDLDTKGSGGRLLLLPAAGGLYLYTGEAPAGAGFRIGPLGLRALADGMEIRFNGPLLRFDDTSPFLDLEVGLSGARLCEVSLELRFVRAAATAPVTATVSGGHSPFDHVATGFGLVRGSITGIEELRDLPQPGSGVSAFDGVASCELSGHAFLDGEDSLRGTLALGSSVPAAPSGALRILVPRRGQPLAYRYRAGTREPLTVENVCIEKRRLSESAPAFRLALRDPAGRPLEILGSPGPSIPIVRQLPQGRTARYDLAFCRYDEDGSDAGSGWTEISSGPDGS
jgi:hypothetical protein